MYQERVAAADNQRNIGLKSMEIRRRWSATNPRRKQMCFVVMNPKKGLPQNKSNRLRRFQPHQQNARQPRTLGSTHGIQIIRRYLPLSERRAGNGQKIFQVLARSQLGDDSSVFG